MSVEIEIPSEYLGPVSGDLASRRGLIASTEPKQNATVIIAEVPLSSMFGYSTDIRSMTKGQGGFSMEFLAYRKAPSNVQEDVIAASKLESAKS